MVPIKGPVRVVASFHSTQEFSAFAEKTRNADSEVVRLGNPPSDGEASPNSITRTR